MMTIVKGPNYLQFKKFVGKFCVGCDWEILYGYILYCLWSENFPVHSIKACKGGSRVQVHPRRGHEGPEGE